MPQVYAILDRDALASWSLDLGDVARALIDGGAHTLQLRAKGASYDELLPLATSVVRACRGAISEDRIFINDDVDVAMRLSVGVHLGQDDVSPMAARARLGPSARIGFSTHDERQLRHGMSLPVDYVALGPVRQTTNKLRPEPTLGVEEAAAVARRAKLLPGAKPLVAIGGIAADVVRNLSAFDLVAVIGCVLPIPGESAAAALSTITRRTRELSDACAPRDERSRMESA